MSSEMLIRIICAVAFSLGFSWLVFSRYDTEVGDESSGCERQRYLPYIPGDLLPMFIIVMAVLVLVLYGAQEAARITLSVCFGIFLHISVYYVLLTALLPLLRKHISARTCAMLWMIPNYLYIVHMNYMTLPEPLLVIRASGVFLWVIFAVWLVGFLAVMVWKIVSHLKFRSRILKDAVNVTDEKVLEIWQKEIDDARIKKSRFKLVVSPHTATPLSVGLFDSTTRVVLPQRSYTDRELALIFRHEIVHIGRQDRRSKFFLVFCTAMCWFNPLVWMAMRRSADDMELSCDETVLLDADDVTRRQYADLILRTAGDERGFTTCLSASASAMRYRLKNIVKPRRLRSGALIVGLVFFVLVMSCGYVALAYGDSTVGDTVFQENDPASYEITHVTYYDDEFNSQYECAFAQAFNEYIAGLELYSITGNYSFENSGRELTVLYDGPDGTLGVTLADRVIKVIPLYGENRRQTVYYLYDGVDWEYVDTLVMRFPAMKVSLTEAGDEYGKELTATLMKLQKTENGETTVIEENDYLLGEVNGAFGYEPDMAELSFSYELASAFTVRIESWDREESYTVSQTELEQPYLLQLPDYPAHYTVYAEFYDADGCVYEAEFMFDIGEI